MTHIYICCDVMVVNILLLPAHKGTIFVRGNYEYILYKITHYLLEKYILKEYIIYSIFQRCTKKLNRLILCACVSAIMLSWRQRSDILECNLVNTQSGYRLLPKETISRRWVVHYTNF